MGRERGRTIYSALRSVGKKRTVQNCKELGHGLGHPGPRHRPFQNCNCCSNMKVLQGLFGSISDLSLGVRPAHHQNTLMHAYIILPVSQDLCELLDSCVLERNPNCTWPVQSLMLVQECHEHTVKPFALLCEQARLAQRCAYASHAESSPKAGEFAPGKADQHGGWGVREGRGAGQLAVQTWKGRWGGPG